MEHHKDETLARMGKALEATVVLVEEATELAAETLLAAMAGKAPLSEAKARTDMLRDLFTHLLAQKVKLEKLGTGGHAGGGALDLEAARLEIGRRMAGLARATGGGAVDQ